MGQKVNPRGARVGVIFDWSTRWYTDKKSFAKQLKEDYELRGMLKEKFYATGISRIDVERSANKMTVNIFTGKPGMIIGRGGKGIEDLKKEKRIAFRRAMKQSIQRAMKAGAKGVKIAIAGRVGGADIARTEQYHEGSIPLQTLRANIDYGFCEAKTTYGRLGIKVWIYKGQVLPKPKKVKTVPAAQPAAVEGGK